MPYRIIQWTSGHVGRHALQHVIDDDRFTLVGVRVHSAEKAGRDAGELCGRPSTGVLATNDVAALLALDADCVLYMSADAKLSDPTEPGSPGSVLLGEICSLLRSGKNVVSTALTALIWPPKSWQPAVDRIEEACLAGRTSFRCVGAQPGFMNDALLLFLSGLSQRIDLIVMQTVMDWGPADKFEMLRSRGYGLNAEDFEAMWPGGRLGGEDASDWVREAGTMIRMVADNLSIPLDSIQGHATPWISPMGQAVAKGVASGVVTPGTVGALHVRIVGASAGQPAVTVERIVRLGNESGPDFPRLNGNDQGYRLHIVGAPTIRTDVVLGSPDHSTTTDTQLATAAIAVNSVPAVCAAATGFQTVRTLPLIFGEGAYRPLA